jgi:hypothetical protein
MPNTTSEEKMVRSYCGLCGPITGCGINCYVKDGKLVRIEDVCMEEIQKQKVRIKIEEKQKSTSSITELAEVSMSIEAWDSDTDNKL